AIRDPRTFTNLEADKDAAAIEAEVSDRVALAISELQNALNAGRPWFEPAWLVVNAIPGEKRLRCETDDLAVHDQAGCVEDDVLVKHRQSYRHHKAGGERDDLLENISSADHSVRRMKRVLAAVPGDAK